MRRIITLILLLCISFTLVGCSNIKYDENEVKTEAAKLISKSSVLDQLFWGKGIEYIPDLNYANGSYYMANPLSLLTYGVETVSDIEALASEVFSTRYAKSSLQSVFGSKDNENFVYVLVRYYQKYSDAEKKYPECIMVNSKYEPILTDEIEYLYDTIKVLNSDKERIYITIDVNVKRGDKTQNKTIDVALVIEDGKYKIDTPTYTAYTAEE